MFTRTLRNVALITALGIGGLWGLTLAQAPARAQERKGVEPPVARVEAAPSGTQVINGDFESGPGAGWTEYSLLGQPIIFDDRALTSSTDVTPHGGAWLAWLGGTEDADEISYIKQQVTIDSAAPVLAYWHYVESIDVCGWDWARVLVNGTEVIKVSLCMNTNTGSWVRRTVDLSAYTGQTVWIQFEADTNRWNFSSWFVDDVILEAAAGPTSTPTATGTATATRTPTSTRTSTGTATATPSRTPTASSTPAGTATSTATATASPQPTGTATNTPTLGPASTGTPTPTLTPRAGMRWYVRIPLVIH
jgi:hypothetical protein